MNGEKRKIDKFEVITSLWLGSAEYILAEDTGKNPPEPYMTCIGRCSNSFGIAEYTNVLVSSDYFEILDIFTKRISEQSKRLVKERAENGLPDITLTADDCIKGGLDKNLEGQIVILKAQSLSPEYRTAEHQLEIAENGFGCAPNSRGNAVYCKNLYSGEEARFEKYNILGVADINKLPEWARLKIQEYSFISWYPKTKRS